MTDWVIIFIRFALAINLMLLFGVPLFRLYSVRGAERLSPIAPAFGNTILLLAVAAPLLAFIGLVLVCAEMAGTPATALDRGTVEMVVTQTPIGLAWQVRMAALAITLVLALAFRLSHRGWIIIALSVSGAIALASLVWTGHGAAGEGFSGNVQLVADIVHLIAAGVWVGALAVFVQVLFSHQIIKSADHALLAARALQRFAPIGTGAVAAIVVSGLINGYMLVGPENIRHMPSSPYGQLLILKLFVFAGMLALAAGNRFRLTPELEQAIGCADTRVIIGKLRLSLTLETGSAVAVLFLVSWLGTLEPPISAV